MALFRLVSPQAEQHFQQMELRDTNFNFLESGFTLLDFEPNRAIGGAPDHTPDRVADLLDQAITNHTNGHWDASGAMARKCLDVATRRIVRDKLPEEEATKIAALWLKARIEKLSALGIITEDIASLARLIKDGGDDASHDDDPYTDAESAKLLEFTRVFLTYVFTIPGMVAQAAETTPAT